jgi:Transposase DDE domain
VPYKANADRRHHIPKQRHRITNWAAYDASLRARGSLTIWLSEAAIKAWHAAPRTTRGGQPTYSALAITTALTLRSVFRLALRQTEGLIGSILNLLGLDLAVPDHSTLSRRAETLEVVQPRSRPERSPYICWWTAPACACADRAIGCWSNTAAAGVGPGENCTWPLPPTRVGSSHRC